MLVISGDQGNQINSALTVNGGIVDMNGKSEGLTKIGGTGGTIYNTASATTSTITLGIGTTNYAGVFQDLPPGYLAGENQKLRILALTTPVNCIFERPCQVRHQICLGFDLQVTGRSWRGQSNQASSATRMPGR